VFFIKLYLVCFQQLLVSRREAADLTLAEGKAKMGISQSRLIFERKPAKPAVEKKMLICKDVVVMNVDGDSTGDKALVAPYDRVYLEYGPNDPIEPLTKNNKKKPVQHGGKPWVGTRPKEDVTSDASMAAVQALVQDAVNYAETKWGGMAGFKALPAESKGWLIMLAGFAYGSDLWAKAGIAQAMRPKAAKDPDKALAKLVQDIIASYNANGKSITQEKALAKAELLMAEDEEEVAA
jgi:hypothetical protein